MMYESAYRSVKLFRAKSYEVLQQCNSCDFLRVPIHLHRFYLHSFLSVTVSVTTPWILYVSVTVSVATDFRVQSLAAIASISMYLILNKSARPVQPPAG